MKTSSYFLLAILFLDGCASNPYTAAHKAGIHTVQLAGVVTSDQEMRYGVDASRPDDLRSTVTTEMMNDAGQDGLRRMKRVMKKNHYDVPGMIHDRLEQKLRDQSRLSLAAQPPADGVFTAKILQYGFTDMPFSLMHEIPFVVVQIKLSDQQGHTVWIRKSKWSLPAEDEAGASWDEYETHPNELQDEWNTQINRAVDKLIPN